MSHILIEWPWSGVRRAYYLTEYVLIPGAALLGTRARVGTRRDAIAWLAGGRRP